MLATTIESYGGPYVDEEILENPESQLAADLGNRAFEDLAQLTRTGWRAMCQFLTVAAGNPTSVVVFSMWGSGVAQEPTVSRSGVGLYQLTWPASFNDGLGESETVVFQLGDVAVQTNTNDDDTGKIKSIAANVVTIATFRAGALSDFGAAGIVTVFLR